MSEKEQKPAARRNETPARTGTDAPVPQGDLSPAMLKQLGQLDHALPSGAFDPHSQWSQTWRIWYKGKPWDKYVGYFEIASDALSPDGSIILSVERYLVQWSQCAVQETKAKLTCNNDAVASLRSWTLQSRLIDLRNNQEYAMVALSQNGQVNGDGIQVTSNGQQRGQRISANVTCPWSLLTAVQCFKPGAPAIPFALLDNLDELKLNQTLTYGGPAQVSFGTQNFDAHRWRHTGNGIQPYTYYVGDSGRLLIAESAGHAYILDPDVKDRHRRTMQWLSQKGRR